MNTLLTGVWEESGSQASELFVLQQLEAVLEQAAKVPERLHLKHINVIDNGDGKALAGLINVYPQIIRQFLTQVEETLGINLIGKD